VGGLSIKTLVTGARGLLGTHLANYLDFIGVDKEECDIRNAKEVKKVFKQISPDLVVHLAAIVDVSGNNEKLIVETNHIGTENVAKYSKQMLYISTDYVFSGSTGNYKEYDKPNPRSIYGLSKLNGEQYTDKVIRTSFKDIPFKHDQAPDDMYTSADYVPVIAYNIALAIKNYEKLPSLIHIGTERKSVYDLAIRTKPSVERIKLKDIKARLPRDCSLNTDLWKSLNLT